ncbi:MAG TPA: GWxTD domain-containing protein [Terriglobia bacterium]|nr:GWxTD domain-containing protein [Terriglobia bacterium]
MEFKGGVVLKRDAFFSRHKGKTRWVGGLLSAFALILGLSTFQASPAKDDQDKTQDNQKPKVTKEEKRRQKALRNEMETPYKKWLSEEVPYIITNEERAAFKKFTTDDERESFIENFWDRRNPNPGSPENEFKEEYYRRIAYANERFASGIPGWKTDRGRIYIMYGPADEVDTHPSGGTYERPQSEGGGETSTFPFEDWRYRYIDGIGTNIILEFVDPTMTGEYHLTMDPGEKDALLHVPGAGLTMAEQMGQGKSTSKQDRFNRTDGMTSGMPMGGALPESMNEFTRLDLFAKIFQPPEVKFKDLKAVVTARLSTSLLPFEARTDFIRVTDETVLTPITVQVNNSDLQFQNKEGVMHGVLDIYIEITSLGGKIVNTTEKSLALDVPEHEFQQYQDHKSIYQEPVPLRPGRYKLSIVLKDDLNGHMGSEELGIVVPNFGEDKLNYSSLILADQILPLPTAQVGSGPFVIGGTRVRPSVNNTFTRDQRLGIYMQVYNLGIDDKTHKPSLDVRYEIEKDGKALLDQPEDAANLKKASQQFTVVKTMGLQGLAPGKYSVQIKVTDNIKQQSVSPSATFEVR